MRWIVLTPAQAAKYKQYKITDWWGIDPIQTKDKRWVLREDQISELEDFKIGLKAAQISKTNVAVTELKTVKTIVELTDKDFPEAEIEEQQIQRL